MYKMLLGFGVLGITLYFIGRVGDFIALQVSGFILVASMFGIFVYQKLGKKCL